MDQYADVRLGQFGGEKTPVILKLAIAKRCEHSFGGEKFSKMGGKRMSHKWRNGVAYMALLIRK